MLVAHFSQSKLVIWLYFLTHVFVQRPFHSWCQPIVCCWRIISLVVAVNRFSGGGIPEVEDLWCISAHFRREIRCWSGTLASSFGIAFWIHWCHALLVVGQVRKCSSVSSSTLHVGHSLMTCVCCPGCARVGVHSCRNWIVVFLIRGDSLLSAFPCIASNRCRQWLRQSIHIFVACNAVRLEYWQHVGALFRCWPKFCDVDDSSFSVFGWWYFYCCSMLCEKNAFVDSVAFRWWIVIICGEVNRLEFSHWCDFVFDFFHKFFLGTQHCF